MEWRPIKNTNYLYWVSEYGDVWHTGYCKIYKDQRVTRRVFYAKFLNFSYPGLGYRAVSIFGKSTYCHRLVAEHFLDTPTNQCVNHKDGNKLNNHYTNLEWVTFKENSEHASKTGLINRHSEKRKKQAPLNAKRGGIKNRVYKSLGRVYEIDYKTQTLLKIHDSIYDIGKKTDHIWTSRNRAVHRLEHGEVKRSGKISTYFLWEEDYEKFKHKLNNN